MSPAKQIYYTLDANADAIITFRYPDHDFAVWEEPVVDARLSTVGHPHTNITKPSSTENQLVDDSSEYEILYRVSSRHLALSSGYFKNALSKGWPEGRLNESDLYQLSTEDWDQEAFLILMNILHLHNNQVPREITLEMLAKIAVLVDYYQCQEAVVMFADIWVQNVTSKVLRAYNRDLVLWICVAWVFGLPAEFEKATEVALKHCKTSTIETLGLPIPLEIPAQLEAKRNQAITEIISGCQTWIDIFRDNYSCPYEGPYSMVERELTSFSCGSILLGALMKETHRLKFLSPCPEIPFDGWSIESVHANIRIMKSPKWGTGQLIGQKKFGAFERRYCEHSCSLQSTVVPAIDALVSGIKGLDIQNFKGNPDDM